MGRALQWVILKISVIDPSDVLSQACFRLHQKTAHLMMQSPTRMLEPWKVDVSLPSLAGLAKILLFLSRSGKQLL